AQKDAGTEQGMKLREMINMDVERCFSEEPRLSCRVARNTLRRVLLAHAHKHRSSRPGQMSYRQGFHEIAAVMLLICMDGTWTSGAENAQAASTSKEVVNSDDLEVYRELGDAAAVPADAYALFDALLSVHRLGEMYE
ncbi:unnamed protein product, partial [Polarella glacialis]